MTINTITIAFVINVFVFEPSKDDRVLASLRVFQIARPRGLEEND